MKKKIRMKLIFLTGIVLCSFLVVSFWLDTTATVISENEPIQKRCTIIIDAGHGGEDGGAVSCTGVLESKINLDVALKLNDFLHLLGMNTKMIRTTDCSVYTEGTTISARKRSDLKNRIKYINETEQGILVSIHQNYYSQEEYSGGQVFYSDYKDSKQLAESLQLGFMNIININSNRKVKKADGIYIMENATCPAVLVECGFLSNCEEEAKLRDAAYQKKIAAIIACCLSCYIHDDAIT